MKKILSLVLASALALSLAACGTPSTPSTSSTPDAASSAPAESGSASSAAPSTNALNLEGAVATVNLGADPKTIDPSLNSAADGNDVLMNTFETLLRNFDGSGITSAAAESYTTSDDGLVWTFKIRPTAKWSDGQPLKAQDFVFSWQRTVDPKTASEYAYFFYPILNAEAIVGGEKDKSELGVKAIDDSTLEVTLAAPCGYFEELVAFPTLSPEREDVVDENGLWAKDPAKAISNGPFYLTDYQLGSHLTLSKNPHYWDVEKTKLDHLVMKMIVDQSTILTAFNSNEILWANKAPTEEIPNLIASGDLEVYPYLGTYFFVINQETSIEALKDKRVRQAISMAIDRQQICDLVTRGGETPATSFVSPGVTDADGKDFKETAGDYYLKTTAQVEEAKALLTEAGYPNGEGIPELEIMFNTDGKHQAIAEAVQEMLKTNLGISVKLNNQEWAVFQDTRIAGDYPAIARHGWIGDYTDPQTFLDMFMSINGKPNDQAGCGYLNPEYDAAVKEGMANSGKARYDAFYKAEAILMEDANVIPVQYYVNTILSSPSFTGWYLSPIGKIYFGRAELAA